MEDALALLPHLRRHKLYSVEVAALEANLLHDLRAESRVKARDGNDEKDIVADMSQQLEDDVRRVRFLWN